MHLYNSNEHNARQGAHKLLVYISGLSPHMHVTLKKE
jgi:hypothetical protein